GPGPGRLPPTRGRARPLPGRRGTISARRLEAGHELLQPYPQRATQPFLGAVFPCRLPSEGTGVGSGQGGPECLRGSATRLRLDLPLSELCQRKVASVAGSRGRFSQGAAAQSQRGRALCPAPHAWDSPLQSERAQASYGRLPLGNGPEARSIQRLSEPGARVSRAGTVRASRGAGEEGPAAPPAGPGGPWLPRRARPPPVAGQEI